MFLSPGSRARQKPTQTRSQILTGVRSRGAVRMFPRNNVSVPYNQLPNLWVVLDPLGNEIPTTGTLTSGLQEAINAAVYNGWPLEVRGHGSSRISSQTCTTNATNIVQCTTTIGLVVGAYVTGSGIPSFTQITSIDSLTQIHISNAATSSITTTLAFSINDIFINCNAPISVPPVEQWSARFYDTNITFSSTINGPLFQFDSCMIVDVGFYGGQVVGQPSTGGQYLVYFNPRNAVPDDGIVAITGSRFHFSNLAYSSSGGTNLGVIGWNLSAGSINNSFFASQEVNGTGASSVGNTFWGGVVFGLQPNTAFEQNIIDISDVHLLTSAGLQLGVSSANAQNIFGNIWRIGGIRPNAGTAGISTFGSYDLFEVGAITNEEAGGVVSQGINYQSGSVGNKAIVGQFMGVTTAIVDNGVGNALWSPGSLTMGSCSSVVVGLTSSVVTQSTIVPRIQVISSAGTGAIGAIRTVAPGAGGAIFALSASRGTPTAPAAVQNGDGIGQLLFSGDNGAGVAAQCAVIQVAAEGTYSSASQPSRMIFATTSSGSAVAAEGLRLDSVQNTINKAGRNDQSYSYLQPASSAFSITLSASNYSTIIDTSATVASATITMSSNPIDGQMSRVVTSQSITTLTISPSSGQTVKGAPTTLAAGGRFEAIYRSANATWYI